MEIGWRFFNMVVCCKRGEHKKERKKWFELSHIRDNHPRNGYEKEYDESRAWCETQKMQDCYIQSWITCPKWLSSVLYIAMGWLCVLAFVPIFHALPRAGFDWLLAGGIIYTIGGVIYALKVPLFNSRHKNFGSHEVFHVFIMLGSACHFIVMYFFVAPLPV